MENLYKTDKKSIFCVFRKSGFLEENVRKDKITGANDVYRNRYIAIKKNDFGVEPKKSPTTRIYNEIGYKHYYRIGILHKKCTAQWGKILLQGAFLFLLNFTIHFKSIHHI